MRQNWHIVNQHVYIANQDGAIFFNDHVIYIVSGLFERTAHPTEFSCCLLALQAIQSDIIICCINAVWQMHLIEICIQCSNFSDDIRAHTVTLNTFQRVHSCIVR
jgi:hypothetical protein